MDAIEHLEARKWEHPSDYGGFSPDGDYVVLSRGRDSGPAENSNYICAYNELTKLCEKFEPPEVDEDDPRDVDWRNRWTERTNGWVYDFRAAHWACGWVEYLMVRDDAPDEIKQAAGEIVCALEDYPILDDEDFSERENELMQDRWNDMPTKERLRMFIDVKAECSIFAARHDQYPDDWRVQDWLRSE